MGEQQKQKDMAILSAVAYTNFFDRNGKNLKEDQILDQLKFKSELSSSDIEYFDTNFEVIHQQLETPRGFSAALIKDKRTGQLTLAIRGTQEPIDFVQDINLVNSGLAVDQL
ncbi:hypothetical protein, partial [Gallibacterium anatis]